MASDPARSVGDDVNTTGDHQDNRVVSQENEVTGESKRDKVEHRADNESQASIKKDDDKWKPVVNASEKDKILMPPPGGFLRPPTGYNS